MRIPPSKMMRFRLFPAGAAWSRLPFLMGPPALLLTCRRSIATVGVSMLFVWGGQLPRTPSRLAT